MEKDDDELEENETDYPEDMQVFSKFSMHAHLFRIDSHVDRNTEVTWWRDR